MPKPNLFIVGTQKSGTSSLYTYLRSHPDVFFPDIKEPNYFCSDLREESDRFHGRPARFEIRTMKDYLSLFSEAKEKVIGDASTNYLYSSDAAKNIHKFNPKAKIIAIFRDPVSFIYSYHSQMLYNLTEDEKDFSKALSLEESRKRWKNVPKTAFSPSFLFYKDLVKYSDQLKRYTSLFPKENILVLLLDDFKEDVKGMYRKVLSFLGLPYHETDFRVINPHKTVRSRKLEYLVSKSKAKRIIKKILPRKASSALGKAFLYLNLKRSLQEPMEEGLRERLKKEFRPEVIKLQSMIGRDLLKKWGY